MRMSYGLVYTVAQSLLCVSIMARNIGSDRK